MEKLTKMDIEFMERIDALKTPRKRTIEELKHLAETFRQINRNDAADLLEVEILRGNL